MSPPVQEKIETTPTKKWVKFEEEEGIKTTSNSEKEETHIKQNGELCIYIYLCIPDPFIYH